MICNDDVHMVSMLAEAAARLRDTPCSGKAVGQLLTQIELLTAEDTPSIGKGTYAIGESNWTLTVIDGAFAITDQDGVLQLKVVAEDGSEEAGVNTPPDAEQAETFEQMLSSKATRECFGILSELMIAQTGDPQERKRQIKLVAEKLGIVVISL